MEDYRWAVLRGRMKPWQFQVFNLFFIVLYQNALLVLITLPALIAWQNPAPLNGVGCRLRASLFAAFLVGETVADQQQWNFHRAKRRGRAARSSRASSRRASGGSAGIRTSSSSRPSGGRSTRSAPTAAVASGLGVWGGALNWTIVGCGSAHAAVHRLDGLHRVDHEFPKYPRYAEYQRTTSMLVPLPPRRARAPRTA